VKRARLCAVALHDVAPSTFDRCVQIRDWLAERGVTRATMLVIPAGDLHPFDVRSPGLAAWLRRRSFDGDAVAQHGFRHLRVRRAAIPRRWIAHAQGREAAEFPGLDQLATRSAVRTGMEVMSAAGIRPRGFVAPAYAYTRSLRDELEDRFEWWAGLVGIHRAGRRTVLAPAHGLGTSGPFKRLVSPLTARAGACAGGRVLRIDVHPADFDLPHHVRALESMLRGAAGRSMVSYDELVAG
jgi:predicted deacetylase